MSQFLTFGWTTTKVGHMCKIILGQSILMTSCLFFFFLFSTPFSFPCCGLLHNVGCMQLVMDLHGDNWVDDRRVKTTTKPIATKMHRISYMVNFLDWIPIFEWCMTRLGTWWRQQHMLWWDWTKCTKYNDYIKVNNEQNWEDMCDRLRRDKDFSLDTYNFLYFHSNSKTWNNNFCEL